MRSSKVCFCLFEDVKTGGSDSDLLVLWSRSDDLMEDIVQEVIPISFGPTKAYHQYEITMSKSVVQSRRFHCLFVCLFVFHIIYCFTEKLLYHNHPLHAMATRLNYLPKC